MELGNPFLEYVLLFLIRVVLLYLKLRFAHRLLSLVLDRSIPGFSTFARFHFQNFELFRTMYDYGLTHRIAVGELPRVETKKIFQNWFLSVFRKYTVINVRSDGP